MTEVLRSQLVATVLSVAVSRGDRVEPGDEVALLESMKMEIPVLAESPGVVDAVHVVAGDVVQEGDPLATLRP